MTSVYMLDAKGDAMFSWWKRIPVGTKSVLFGAHAFWLHWIYVAIAWTKLYGFPKKIQYWVAFFVHDCGYIGCQTIDGPDGEKHVELGAHIMGEMFDKPKPFWTSEGLVAWQEDNRWYEFSLFHSRHWAKAANRPPSMLCFADKLAFCCQIKWLYLFMCRLTGELDEYIDNAFDSGFLDEFISSETNKYTNRKELESLWYDKLVIYMKDWVYRFKDGEEDTVTKVRVHAGDNKN